MNCRFCPATVASDGGAVRAGWEPYFYDGDTEHDGPVCPDCFRRYLRRGADGEIELRPGVCVPDPPTVVRANP